MRAPTKASIEKRMAECRRIGEKAFLEQYANKRPPQRLYVLDDEGRRYPMKALWATAWTPRILPRQFKSDEAMRGFEARGYKIASLPGGTAEASAVLAFQAEEGERYRVEVGRIRRNAAIVAKAKEHYGPTCRACGFDFEEFYGEQGRDFIECHHVDPLSGRDGKGEITTIEQLRMVCSNCHRMIHRSKPCLTVDELKEMIDQAKQ